MFIQLIVVDSLKMESARLPKKRITKLMSFQEGTQPYIKRIKKMSRYEGIKGFVFGPGYQKKEIK